VTHTNVYVSLAVERLSLAEFQEQVCSRFGLRPRPELHVTLGYIGEAEHGPLEALARELAPLAHEQPGTPTVTGLGGAVEGGAPITPETTTADLDGRSRVLWWAVERTDALLRAHDVLRDAVRKVGLSDRFFPTEYYPHITVGSLSGAGEPDPKSWDVHDVPKLATLGRANCPATVPAQRLHVTRTDLHSQSLFTIAEYGHGVGVVVWFTGWPSSGKSTLAREVSRRLLAEGTHCAILDSDEVRHCFPWLGYSEEDRGRVYASLIGLAGLLASQGHVVLVPATAPARAVREEARKRLPRFVEVFVSTPRAECATRDPKDLYGSKKITFEYEPPLAPEVTTAGASDETGIEKVLECVRGLRGSHGA
jgi:adenylylsulfate kinase